MMQVKPVVKSPERRLVQAGTTGGIVGGICFGLLLAGLGTLPLIAELVGSSSVVIGFIVHMLISALFGALFGLFLELTRTPLSRAISYGFFYGLFWWVAGALTLMPILLGVGPNYARAFSQASVMSLLGHIVYGVVLGATVVLITRSDWFRQR